MRALACLFMAALAAPLVAVAQDAAPPPLTPAAAADRFAACRDRLDTAEGLQALAELARDAHRTLLTPRDAPALRRIVIDGMLPALRARFTRRQGLGHGEAQRAVATLYVALREPAVTADVLAALANDLPRTRELLPLCASIAALSLDEAQDDAFFAAVRDALRRRPRDVDRLLPAIERRPGERWLRLLAETVLPAVAQLQPDGPGLAWAIAKSLGRFWDGPPHLRYRVPALLRLLRVPDAELQAAAIEGLDRLTFQPVGNPGRFAAVWRAFERRLAGADDAALVIGLLRERLAEARAGGDDAGLAADLAARLPALGRPGSTWATSVLLEVFAWEGAALAPARGAAIVALRHAGDPAAVAPLVALVSGRQGWDARAEADAIAAIGVLAGESSATVDAVLRRSLREGRPLPRRAAAVALGQLRVAGAVDELLAFGDGASGVDAAEAWKAVARIGTGAAAEGLLARLDPEMLAECEPVVRALGHWPAWPLPDALAERLGAIWDLVWDGPALPAGQIEGLREALGEATLGGPLDGDRRFRGCMHASLVPRLHALALARDAAAAPHAHRLCERLSTVDGDADGDAWPVLRDVLAARPDDARAAAALRWVVAHPDPLHRDAYVAFLAGAPPSKTRVALLGLLGRPGIWDDDTCWPAVLGQLRFAATEDLDVLKAGVAVVRERPSIEHAPAIIALLPVDPQADGVLAIQVGSVLWAWGQRATGVAWPDLPNARPVWQAWWARFGAKVGFR